MMLWERLVETTECAEAYQRDAMYHMLVDVVRASEAGGRDPIAALRDATRALCLAIQAEIRGAVLARMRSVYPLLVDVAMKRVTSIDARRADCAHCGQVVGMMHGERGIAVLKPHHRRDGEYCREGSEREP